MAVSPNTLTVLDFLKANYGEEYTRVQIGELLGLATASVSGSVNSFIKKGVASQREETVEVEVEEGKKPVKPVVVKYVTLTEMGLTFDPIAEEEAKKEALAAERAAKKAAKAAATEE